jgi:hypothetical protein
MYTIPQSEVVDNLPWPELAEALAGFLAPLWVQLPDKRLHAVAALMVRGILGGQSPLISQMARGVKRTAETIRPQARRMYRFVRNERFSHRELLKGLYGVAQQHVAHQPPGRLVVAVDPVNLEKCYTEELEGVSTVLKSTPPGPEGKRLTTGYPAITATIVNLPEPVVTYANWFSYETADFVSENRELYRALRITRALFPEQALCFTGDAGLDDQKIFRVCELVDADFVIRGYQERQVEVYNERLDRWETEKLSDLIATVPLSYETRLAFTHARHTRVVDKHLGCLKIRLPAHPQQILWVLVVYDPQQQEEFFLLTNISLDSAAAVKRTLREWRLRAQVEHTYRFDQEDGLDLEDVRVHTLERMRRIFVLVLLAALFVYHIDQSWSPDALLWLRRLGGKFGLPSDADGPYVLLAGIRAVFMTAATLSFAARHPFPRDGPTCG